MKSVTPRQVYKESILNIHIYIGTGCKDLKGQKQPIHIETIEPAQPAIMMYALGEPQLIDPRH